jgi:hypothetical protein
MFEELKKEVDNGRDGKNKGLPFGFPHLNRYISLRGGVYNLIFGPTGSGKSTLAHNMFILNPLEWYLKHKPPFKFKVILFSMERSKRYILAKWATRRIFLKHGVYIPFKKILGIYGTLTDKEYEYFLDTKEYFEELKEYVDIVEGPQNPTGVYMYVKKYAESNGRIEKINEYEKVYEPNNKNEVVVVVIDHLGLTKVESKAETKKQAIDKMSEYCQYFIRDLLNYTPVCVSQLTRNLNNPMFLKLNSFEPTLDDVKESGDPCEDSDCVISIFEPIRYRTEDPFYNALKFIDKTGAKHFRSVKILKNTYGEDDIRIGMGFMGGMFFSELPTPKNMETFDYESLFNYSYYYEKYAEFIDGLHY